jgi:hypothetical protein
MDGGSGRAFFGVSLLVSITRAFFSGGGSFCPRALAQGLTALARAIVVLATNAGTIWKYSTDEID